MALKKCLECGQEISDKALTCPKCGNPLQNINEITQKSPVTIEQTKKTWKIIRLISWIVIVIGIIFILSYFANNSRTNFVSAGGFLLFAGIVGNLIGKFGAWWTNK